MAKTVLFVLLDHYAESDCAYLSNAIVELSNNDIQIKTVSLDHKPIKSQGGFTTVPDYKLKNIPKNHHGIVLVGSDMWKEKQSHLLFPIIEHALRNHKVVASISSASEFLAAHGFFNSVNHTANGIDSILAWENHIYTNSNAYQNSQSVRDGNIISANSSASLKFARDTLRALNLIEDRKIGEWYAFHKLGYCDLMMQ